MENWVWEGDFAFVIAHTHNACMNDIPNLHDGFFDGLWLSGTDSANLFFRTADGELFTVAVEGVSALNVSSICAGNIIFDVVLVQSEELTSDHIKSAREIAKLKPEDAERLLAEAKRNGMSALEINPSYGAEGTILFKSVTVISGHVLKDRLR